MKKKLIRLAPVTLCAVMLAGCTDKDSNICGGAFLLVLFVLVVGMVAAK